MKYFGTYVALGDSISIDDYAGGPGLGAASLLFRNRDDRFPAFKGKDVVSVNPTARFHMLAVDGGRSFDVMAALETLPQRLGRFEKPTLFTLTVGGNDLLGWWALGSNVEKEIGAFSSRLEHIVATLRHLDTDATIAVGNVYDPTDGTGVVQSGRDLKQGLPVLYTLNDVIASVAHRWQVALVDIYGHFLGHGQRHADPAYASYDANDPSGWIVYDIEPNARGSSEVRRLFLEAAR